MSAAYDYSTWNFLRFACLDLVSFVFISSRGNARAAPDRDCVARRNHAFAFACDADVFADSATTYRRTLQKLEGALDWTGRNGRSHLGHCD
jgi:hypothetical protein